MIYDCYKGLIGHILEKDRFCDKYYGYTNKDGAWPNFQSCDFRAATNVVLELYKIIEKIVPVKNEVKKDVPTPFKIRVTPEQSKKVQEILFKFGWSWAGVKKIQFTGYDYLYCNPSKCLYYGTSEKTFEESSNHLLSFQRFMELYGEESCIKESKKQKLNIAPFKMIVNPQQSENVQKILIENGYGWNGGDYTINHLNYKAIILEGKYLMGWSNRDTDYIETPTPELTYEGFMRMYSSNSFYELGNNFNNQIVTSINNKNLIENELLKKTHSIRRGTEISGRKICGRSIKASIAVGHIINNESGLRS